jgi:hypothetical protein
MQTAIPRCPRVAAQAAQLGIEYDPEPPYDAGHPDEDGPEVLARVVEFSPTRR